MLEKIVKRYLRFDCSLLMLAILPVLFLNIGFLFGGTCSAWYFYISLIIVLAMQLVVSWRRALVLLLVVGLLFLLTAYMFSYVTSDAQRCHAVMQRLLVSGWNPIGQCSPDACSAIPCYDYGGISFGHMLHLPKFTAYSGALIAMASSLWVGDAWIGNLIAMVLACVAMRFARLQWGLDGWRQAIFALASLAPTYYISVFVGQAVDYVVYAAMIAAALAYVNWKKSADFVDVVVSLASGVVAVTTKPIASGVVVILVGLILWNARQKKILFCCVGAWVIVVGVILASPLFTSWLAGGVEHGLTNDFTGNAAALKMGYLARIVYAYVSKGLAVKACAWWYGEPAFSPQFAVDVSGRNSVFTVALILSVVGMSFCRRSALKTVWIVLLISCVALPLKYIGYPRYVPQTWILPGVAFFHIAHSVGAKYRCEKRLAGVVALLVGIYCAPFCVRTGLYYLRNLLLENLRQERLEQMAQSGCQYSVVGGNGYWIHHERARMAGVKMIRTGGVRVNVVDDDFVYSVPEVKGLDAVVQVPQLNSLSDLRAMPWRLCFQSLVHPPLPLVECRQNSKCMECH